MEWLDQESHPRLVLDGESIELAYQPIATDHGPGPLLVTFKALCVIKHYTGSLTYTADDLTFEPQSFAAFADGLKQVLQRNAPETTLAPVARELVATVKPREKRKSRCRKAGVSSFSRRQTELEKSRCVLQGLQLPALEEKPGKAGVSSFSRRQTELAPTFSVRTPAPSTPGSRASRRAFARCPAVLRDQFRRGLMATLVPGR